MNKRKLFAFCVVVMILVIVQPLLGCCEQCSCEGCGCESCGCSDDSDSDGSDASEDNAAGTQSPTTGTNPSCTPSAEVHDGRDNDCDGQVDETD
jgi:hypothetical protein